jgi:hypothetical protein
MVLSWAWQRKGIKKVSIKLSERFIGGVFFWKLHELNLKTNSKSQESELLTGGGCFIFLEGKK